MNDADIEMIELQALARERAHAIKNGYCIGCDHSTGPHTYRLWHPSTGGGHTTENHPGVGPIGDLGMCADCEADYLKNTK